MSGQRNTSNKLLEHLILTLLFLTTCLFARADDPPKRKSIVINKDTVQRQEAATIPLGDVAYEEVEPICRQMLSKGGTIGYFARRKAMIVYDNPENVAAIKEMIASVDKPSVNIRLEVSFSGIENTSNDYLDVKFGNGRRPPIVIDDGDVKLPDRIGIDLGSNRSQINRNAAQILVARSGSAATIWAGKRVPDPAWLRTQRFTPVVVIPGYGTTLVVSGTEIPWRDVGSSLQARPTLRADGLVDVELIPIVSYIQKNGRRRNLMVHEVSTKVTVAPGRPMQIGGINHATAQTLSQLGAHSLLGRTGDAHSLNIELKTTVIQPRRSPAAAPYTK